MNETMIVAETAGFSRWFRQLADSDPELHAGLPRLLHESMTAAGMRQWLAAAPAADEAQLDRSLRLLRRRLLAQWMMRDLAGLAPLQEVMEGCTGLAEAELEKALVCHDGWLEAVHGAPRDGEGRSMALTIVAMGKLGGGELNVSSDIDLVYLYAEEGATAGERPVTHHEFFTRLAQRVTRSLAAATTDGFVFRVDTRLRPWGESGPLVMSYDALEDYLTAHGREWERYAWIKARPLSGSRLEALSAIVRPFVFRKYLDFGAISALRALHAQIRREVVRRDRSENIKLGPGGIREIEFIVQVFQLIRGGQDVSLQGRSTLALLPVLAERGLIGADVADMLMQAYVFLRRLEHRLQYLDDAQTQTLPASVEDRLRIAGSMGFDSMNALQQALDAVRADVSRQFDAVFARNGSQDEIHPLAALWLGLVEEQEAESRLQAMGYADSGAVSQRLARIRASVRYLHLPESSRQRFDRLVPAVIGAAAAGQHDPAVTLYRMLDLLEAIAGRAAYLALMEEFPATLQRVAQLCSASDWAAQYLTRNPILLDELIDPRLLDAVPDWSRLAALLGERLAGAEGDTERQMDGLRRFRQQQTFHWLAQDIAGRIDLPALAERLTRLAEVVLRAVLPLAWAGVRGRHRDTPAFAIIGYGKLGSRELGYASDLDMVFLYHDTHADAAELYARLAQRIITWLTAPTPAGVLYDTDLRLRPDGASGLLVSSVAAFRQYQRQHAWTWEHQAITRARFVAGDASIGAEFEVIRSEVLVMPRDPQALRAEVAAMREKIRAGHRYDTALFDLKYDAGGMVDAEFCAQYLVLLHAAAHPLLGAHDGCPAILLRCAQAGLLPDGIARPAAAAWQHFWGLQHALRLQNVHPPRVPPEQVAVQREAVLALWRMLMPE